MVSCVMATYSFLQELLGKQMARLAWNHVDRKKECFVKAPFCCRPAETNFVLFVSYMVHKKNSEQNSEEDLS